VKSKDGILSVQSNLEIEGDVDFKVGNINFKGKVIIGGNVLPGFKIESESDILIHGQIESATIISTGGTVQIEKGIIGKNNSFVKAAKDINVSFAQDCKLECEGTINVETSILHCQTVSENLKTESKNATVIGGKIIAYKSIEVASVSNEEEVPTHLTIMNKVVMELIEKRKKLNDVLKQLIEMFVPLDSDVRRRTTMIKKAGEFATDAHKKELQQVKAKLEAVKSKTTLVEKSIAAIDSELSKSETHEGEILITGDIFPSTVIEIHKKRKLIKNRDHAMKFFIVDGELCEEPIR